MTKQSKARVRVRYLNTRLGVWLYWMAPGQGTTPRRDLAAEFCTLKDRSRIERALRYMPGRVRLELLPVGQEAACV